MPLALLLALTLAAAACGREGPDTAADATAAPVAPPPSAIRVSPEAPLPAVGADTPIPPARPPEGLTFARTVSAGRRVSTVAPRPELPVPVQPRPSTPPAPGELAPRLTGRVEGGKEVVDFALLHTRFVAQISGDVARVEVTQYYANPSKDRLEAVYAFPLPPNAAVTDMLFRVGSRVVLSEVRRRDEARRTYEAARAEGKTAALTEQERPNLFTQSVANIPPGETVAVVLRYVHEVPYDDGRYLFHVPTTIGPRYVPGGGPGGPIPDAAAVTPPVVGPGFRSGADVDVLVRLTPAAAFADVAARSHRIVTGEDGAGARLVALAEGDRVPDRDFVLSYRPAGQVPTAHALLERERGEDYLLLFLQPPAEVTAAQVRPKELVFLLDKSGSMMGAPIDRAKALIERALLASGPDDTFRIVAFDGAAQSMSQGALPATPEYVERARAWLAALSGGGGTEMLTGIQEALRAESDPRRLRMVVFCTDGFIGNEDEIIEAVAQLRGAARVFGFGIGGSVNRYLLEGVAKAGRGAAEVVDLSEDPGAAVTRLFKRLDRPVLTELELSFEGAPVTDLLPSRLPDLLAGQPLVVAGRAPGGAPREVILHGRLGERPWSARVPVATTRVDGPAPVAGTLWARRRVDDLLAASPSAPTPEAVEAIVATALRFKLVTKYTSFVAVERELLVDPALPLARANVPNELPRGVSYEGIFGPAAATSQVQVLPARVKPGDPELRVAAPASAVSVEVTLPFEARPREALRDPARGDFVLRFLVPPGVPDGSYDARVVVRHADGRVEARTAPIRVDTTAATVAVLSAPARAHPGETLRVVLKPSLALAGLPALVDRPGGAGNAVKGAMEVKELLVRGVWAEGAGEPVRAEQEGALGAWVARVPVPAGAAAGAASLEVVAADAAGNVSRRRLPLEVVAAPAPEAASTRQAGLALGALALVLVGLGIAAWTRRARPPAPLEKRVFARTIAQAETTGVLLFRRRR